MAGHRRPRRCPKVDEDQISDVAFKHFFRVEILPQGGTGILVKLHKRAVIKPSEFKPSPSLPLLRKSLKISLFHREVFKMVVYGCQNGAFLFGSTLTFQGPFSAGMNHVPIRPRLLISPTAGVMITEAVHRRVPQRPVQFNQRRLNGPDHIRTGVFKNHKSASEVLHRKVRRDAMLRLCSRSRPYNSRDWSKGLSDERDCLHPFGTALPR